MKVDLSCLYDAWANVGANGFGSKNACRCALATFE